MNERQLPEYFAHGRLVPLSKRQGTDSGSGDIRSIVVRYHLSKIVEKALVQRIESNHKHLLSAGSYQTGFKRYKSTHINLAEVILQISIAQKRHSKRLYYLFIDLIQSYNSLLISKIFETLTLRCKDQSDQFLVDLIQQLHQHQKLVIGDERIDLLNRIAEGSVLSHWLFNIALEESLKSQPLRSDELTSYTLLMAT